VVTDHDSKLIAIVDDDESVQSALQDLLEAVGLSTQCFGSAEEFLKSGQQGNLACLVTDIRMPGMSGLELQAKLHAEKFRLPIIFITAHGDEKLRLQAMRAGAVEFLTKPFNQEVLLDCIQAALAT
jgi:FixJ family two-component response regulator